MKVGITLAALRPSLWTEATLLADELGFESVWMPEHLVFPVDMEGSPIADEDHPPAPPDVPVFEVFTYLSFLAGQTERIRFGTYVYNIGLRHPLAVARAVVTLDVLSRGRFEFGIGASWLRAEWDAVGLDFTSRGRRVDEAVEVCQRLWSEDIVEHHGEFFDFEPVMFVPKPLQTPWPPLHFGGDGPAAFRRAAASGDGWIPLNHAAEAIPGAVVELARAAGGGRSARYRRDQPRGSECRPGPPSSPRRRRCSSRTGEALEKFQGRPRRHSTLCRPDPP